MLISSKRTIDLVKSDIFPGCNLKPLSKSRCFHIYKNLQCLMFSEDPTMTVCTRFSIANPDDWIYTRVYTFITKSIWAVLDKRALLKFGQRYAPTGYKADCKPNWRSHFQLLGRSGTFYWGNDIVFVERSHFYMKCNYFHVVSRLKQYTMRSSGSSRFNNVDHSLASDVTTL